VIGVFLWSGSFGFWTGVWNGIWGLNQGQATLVQTMVLAACGIWAFRLYRKHREGQPKIDFDVYWKVARVGEWPTATRILVLGVRLTNSSRVLPKDVNAEATAYDACQVGADGNLVLRL